MRRVTIIELLGIIGVLAVGLAAIRDGSDLTVDAIHKLTLGALFTALLGVLLRTRPRGAWVGFALFSWGYFLLALVADPFVKSAIGMPHPTPGITHWATLRIHGRAPELNITRAQLNSESGEPPGPAHRAFESHVRAARSWGLSFANSRYIADLLHCLLLGFIGSVLGRALAARREPAESPR